MNGYLSEKAFSNYWLFEKVIQLVPLFPSQVLCKISPSSAYPIPYLKQLLNLLPRFSILDYYFITKINFRFPWVVFCQVSLNPNLWIPILLCSKFQSLLSFSLYFCCSFANLSTMTFSLFQNIFLCRFSPVFLKRGAQKWSNTRA